MVRTCDAVKLEPQGKKHIKIIESYNHKLHTYCDRVAGAATVTKQA